MKETARLIRSIMVAILKSLLVAAVIIGMFFFLRYLLRPRTEDQVHWGTFSGEILCFYEDNEGRLLCFMDYDPGGGLSYLRAFQITEETPFGDEACEQIVSNQASGEKVWIYSVWRNSGLEYANAGIYPTAYMWTDPMCAPPLSLRLELIADVDEEAAAAYAHQTPGS